jgi:hypothetical protein
MPTNINTFKFYPMVQGLEEILNSTEDPLKLIALISENEFLSMRSKIISFFEIDSAPEFTSDFGTEIEFGDVSDAVRETTFSLYPQSTDIDKTIDLAERKAWCLSILDKMDASATYY